MPVTRVLRPNSAGILECARIVAAGGLVAFPTETVYGLGANALEAAAVEGIFRAKGRPANDPLIVHLPEAAAVPQVARPTSDGDRLAARFWPGPLTLVLPRLPSVPPVVTSGLDTVGVRVPAHPVARRLLHTAERPLAAPSANLFGRPSPTRAEHVLDDLDGRIDALLDGGPTAVGVESTIVDVSGPRPRLLRPGGVPLEALEAVLGRPLLLPPPLAVDEEAPHPSPGLLSSHYAPRTPLVLVAGEPGPARARLQAELERASAHARIGLLLLDEDVDLVPPGVVVESVGGWRDPEHAARRLFDALRALDSARLERLYARQLADPGSGLGRALADRLHRAATIVVNA